MTATLVCVVIWTVFGGSVGVVVACVKRDLARLRQRVSSLESRPIGHIEISRHVTFETGNRKQHDVLSKITRQR